MTDGMNNIQNYLERIVLKIPSYLNFILIHVFLTLLFTLLQGKMEK
jgi:hypothetical protein